MKRDRKKENYYRLFKNKLFFRFIGIYIVAFVVLFVIYRLLWFHRGSEWLVSVFQGGLRMDYQDALNLYRQLIRNNAEMIWNATLLLVFLVLFFFFFNWITKYFDMINKSISSILEEDAEIHLPAEMSMTELKLHRLKSELRQRTLEAQLAEQRKNELVMYLAHDIRTPLTSVIGYLSLLADVPDMPAVQKAKYVDISLDNACRLEKMIDEFFEITRYNVQQIKITKEKIDLFYMLVQISDELSPIMSAKGNTVILKVDENMTVSGDPEKLARVFINILKNATAYSFPNTEITVSAEEKESTVSISICNHGTDIPKEKLSSLFEKFYRADEARSSNTGGAGLGLAIAREIITLHGGSITAESENHRVTFRVALPKED